MSTLPRAVWLLADGLPQELIRAYAASRPDSYLAALWREKRVRPLLPLAPNCQTPPSLFTIWSGTEPAVHGLTGYDCPAEQGGDPAAMEGAFEAWPRHIPLVWDLYAGQGRTVRTCAVPFLDPGRLGAELLSATRVFPREAVGPAMLAHGDRLELPHLGLSLVASLQSGRASLADATGAVVWQGTTQHHSPLPLQVPSGPHAGETHQALCLRPCTVDGQLRLAFLGYHPIAVCGSAAGARRASGQGRPYVAANPGKLYASGALGRRIDQGGDSRAEVLLLELMHELHASFAADITWAVEAGDADLTVGYYPVIDLLAHQLLKHAHGPSGQLDGPLAGLLLDAVDWLDGLVADLARRLPRDARFIVNSDHGMSAIRWDLHPNRYFHERGWLAFDDARRIDARRSTVFLHPAENGLLLFHRERMREAGLTPEAVVAALSAQVRTAGLDGLGSIEGTAARVGPDWLAHHYLVCPPGARPRADAGPALVAPSAKGGDHTVCTDDPWLRGTVADAGPMPWLAPGPQPLALSELMPTLLGSKPCPGQLQAGAAVHSSMGTT